MSWYDECYVDQVRLLLNRFSELNINHQEFCVLLFIAYDTCGNMKISTDVLLGQTKLSNEQLDSSLNSLVTKNYLKIKVLKNEIKFDISGCFEKVKTVSEDVFEQDIFELFEEEFGRVLNSNEMMTINEFVKKYTKPKVILALRNALIQNKKSLAYIGKILSNMDNKDED